MPGSDWFYHMTSNNKIVVNFDLAANVEPAQEDNAKCTENLDKLLDSSYNSYWVSIPKKI